MQFLRGAVFFSELHFTCAGFEYLIPLLGTGDIVRIHLFDIIYPANR